MAEQGVVSQQQQTSAEPSAPVAEAVAPQAGAETPQEQAQSKPVDAAAEEAKKAFRGVQKRINELTRKAREAEEAGQAGIEYWRAQAIEAARQAEALHAQTSKPVFDGDIEAYTAKLARHEAQQAINETLAQLRQREVETSSNRQQAEQKAAVEQAIGKAINDVVAIGEKKYPGFAERVTSDELPPMRDQPAFLAILETGPDAADILNYLANNPAKAHEIVGLSPWAQAREVGRIQAAIAAGKTVSSAPPPPGTIGSGKGGAPKDLANASYEEFVKIRRKQIAARR